ncbi:MAG: N-acetyl-gamma-glutamyl-phosphate reductase [Rhodobacteraceae bacterium]|nr:N-acetyl-gamma-glutamyl-phosphate reductase [Paracoccaceae bacterium]
MAYKVFIDGDVGTTGLQIRERLERRDDLTLLRIDPGLRKDNAARLQVYAEADVAILCLPDPAAKEIVALCDAKGLATRIIDASTAHRTHPDWQFGFPEMAKGQRDAIRNAARVSNPGCWSTCAIALIRPLVDAGLIARDARLAISGVSGYSGGGKAMIEEFESGAVQGSFLYGAAQTHKHLPEISLYGGLSHAPVFVPSVGHYAQGMAVAVELALGTDGLARAEATLAAHYAGEAFVSVVPADTHAPRAYPQKLNGTNKMELSVHGNSETGSAALVAILDNLGKGASGAAVQNLNLMLGVDEATSL